MEWCSLVTPDFCKPSVKLVSYLSEAPKLIASSAKLTISNKGFEEVIYSLSDEKVVEWIRELVRRGHGSPLEHSIYSFEIVCSRVASHQFVRHRLASYTQLSQRYSDKYLNDTLFDLASIISYGNNCLEPTCKIDIIDKSLMKINDWNIAVKAICKSFIIPPAVAKRRDLVFIRSILLSMKSYYEVLENGISYEDARYLIPQCVKTRLIVSMNARELLEVFLPLRMCSRAQWEIRFIAWRMRDELIKIHNEIFGYAGPRCVLFNNRICDREYTLEDYLEGRVEFVIPRCPEFVPREKIWECLVNSSKDPWI